MQIEKVTLNDAKAAKLVADVIEDYRKQCEMIEAVCLFFQVRGITIPVTEIEVETEEERKKRLTPAPETSNQKNSNA